MENQVTTTCKNCGHIAKLNFCSSCGQKTDTRRFDGKYLLYKIIHSFDLDRGFFYTIFQLLIRPGLSIRHYVEGKRIGFSSPFRLFLIIGALATLYTVNSGSFETEETGSFVDHWKYWDGFVRYSGRYYSFFQLTGSVVFAFFTQLFFWKSKYNIHELMVLNVYIMVGQLIILLIFSPLAWLLHENIFDHNSVLGNAYNLANTGYNIWVLVSFFKASNFRSVFASLAASTVPLPFSVVMNYWIFVIAPDALWQYLDDVLM